MTSALQNRCMLKAIVPSFCLHSQIVLALASVPLCDRKTLAQYIRMYLNCIGGFGVFVVIQFLQQPCACTYSHFNCVFALILVFS